jgi:ATP-dependent DNA helicase RecG
MHLVEQVGSGVGRIKELMKEANLAEPVFQKEGIFTVILQRSTNNFEKTTQETTQKTTRKTTQKTENLIMEFLFKNPKASRAEIAEALGSITEDGIKYQLNKLKKQGKIERIGPDNGGYWKIIKQ